MNNAFLLSLGLLLAAAPTYAQSPTPAAGPAEAPYRATATKENALVHTKLAVRFDYKKRYLYGKEWLTAQPYAYPTDSLHLDAKGMDIQVVALMSGEKQQKLKYSYDQDVLHIYLGKTYPAGTPYTVYIEYTAKPDELKVKGSAAITDAKGLYFINPDSAVAGKPVQIWTQGETEGSSAWFPTIDRPNQKTTEEIAMTVPSKYMTLSNGALVSQKPAGPGLRTDTWKLDLPHSPYLFMMAVGDFRITRDTWRGKPVEYYVEPKYAAQTKDIFGNTPQMLEFFSTRLGVEFPWNKYAQIICRDYVSGAMENTTATLHGEFLQMSARELLDRDFRNESVIAHELFHQWFGDYVTTESWSNLTVNESMADFSEALWAEHKYGPDLAGAHRYQYRQQYLRNPANYAKDLVRFHYKDKEDMFDAVTYQKGGAIVDMLRNYLGDDVFFKGLNLYLKEHALGNGEAQQMRLAMEKASGKDLNWFYNQWYYGAGQPTVTIDYGYAGGQQTVTLKQTQDGKTFQLPLAIDIYVKGKPERHRVMMTQATQTFRFPAGSKPNLVNVDADKLTLWQKTDNKPLSEFIYQYQHAPLFMDRREALAAAQAQPDDAAARKLIISALDDPFYGLRLAALQALDMKSATVRQEAAAPLRKRLGQEPNVLVQAQLLSTLALLGDKQDQKLYEQYLTNQSYGVQGAALAGLLAVSPATALARAKALESAAQGDLAEAIVGVYALQGGDAEWPYIRKTFDAAGVQQQFNMLPGLAGLFKRTNDRAIQTQVLERMQTMGVKYKKYGIDQPLLALLQQLKQAQPATAAQIDNVAAAIQKAE